MSVENLLRKRRRWMLFIDGENFTLQGQKIASAAGRALVEGPYYLKDTFLWRPITNPNSDPKSDIWLVGPIRQDLLSHAERAFYYTTVTGSEELRQEVRQKLWELGFHPEVFRKSKGAKAKGVDITLTKDMLCHAFQDNYDVAILVAGDGDYVPLVAEVKRLGKIVCVCFFSESGLSPELRLTADHFQDQKNALLSAWEVHLRKPS